MIIGNGPVITNDPANPFVDCGAVRVDGTVVTAVGPLEAVRAAHPHEDFHDVAGRVIMPGLINAHPCLQPLRPRHGRATRRDFVEILENLWWRLDRLLTLEDVEINTTTTFIECIRNGVTTVFDHHPARTRWSARPAPGRGRSSPRHPGEPVLRDLDRDGEAVFRQALPRTSSS